MGLQRLGDSETMRYIQNRVKQIIADLKANPAKARALEAKIEAEKAHTDAMSHPYRAAQQQPQPKPQGYSRADMRRRRIDEDEDF